MRRRPFTHFVGVRLDSPALWREVEAIQAAICERDGPRSPLRQCCYPVTKLHFTLCMLQLDDDDAVRAAARVLDAWFERLEPLPRVGLDGLGAFGERVLFLQPDERSRAGVLGPMAATLAEDLQAAGLIEDIRPFDPHATIMKTSMTRKRAAIDRALWEDLDLRSEEALRKVELLQLRGDGAGWFRAEWEGAWHAEGEAPGCVSL